MAAQNVIELGFDSAKVDQEKARVVAALDEVYQTALKIQNTKIQFGNIGGLADFKAANESLKGIIKDLATLSDRYKKAIDGTAKATREDTTATIANEKAKQAQLKTEEQAAKTKERTEKAEAAAARTKRVVATESERNAKAIDKEDKALEKLNSEYNQLNARQKIAATIAKEMGARYGSASNEFQVAAKRANELYKELFAIESKLGQNQRNVGNYKSGFDGLGNSINQLTREFPAFANSVQTGFLALSNNLPIFFDEIKRVNTEVKALRAEGQATPGVISRLASSFLSFGTVLSLGVTLLTLYGDEFIKYIGSLFQTEKALNRTAEAHKNYTDTLLEGAKNSAQEITNLRVLEKVATDETKSRETRLQAVKDLQEQYPKYLGNLSQEAILSGKAAEQINLVADALYKKAFAEAASNKAGEIAGKQLELELRRNFLLQRNAILTKEVNEARKRNVTDENGINQDLLSAEKELIEVNKILTKNIEQTGFNADQMSFFIKKAADNFDVIKKLEIDPKGKKEKDIKTISDVIAELRKELASIQSQQNLDLLTFSESDNKRAEAYLKTIEELTKNFKLTDKSGLVIDLVAELNPISVRIIEREIADLIDKINQTKVGILPPPGATKEFLDEQTKAYEDSIKFRQTVAAKDYAVQQQQLLIQYTLGKKSRKQYEQELLDIQEDYVQKGLELQIEEYENALKYAFIGVENTQANADKRLEIERKIAELRMQLGQRIDNQDRKSLETRKAGLLKFLSEVQQVFEVVSTLIGGLLDASITKQKNALQDIEDQQQKNYENEVERVSNSSLSEQEKADRLKVLEAQRQAEKQKFDRENREADLRKARFDKANAIASIILNTAVSISKVLGDPFRVVVAAALGAAQLAVAIATPLPRFKDGKNNKYEGPAIVGDGGRKEVIQRKDGSIEVTPDRSTVTWLGKDDIVHKDIPSYLRVAALNTDDINAMAYRQMVRSNVVVMKENDDVVRELRSIKAAIGSQQIRPVVKVYDKSGGLRSSDRYLKSVKGM
jgi:hypothetical protein